MSVGVYCVCGNRLEEKSFLVRVSPCKCASPGEGRSTITREDFLDVISPRQYAERTKLGLPPITEVEKSVFRAGKHLLRGDHYGG